MSNNTINPMLKDLQILIGKWEMELSNASFLPNFITTIKEDISFEWFEGGEFLIMRMSTKKDGMSWAVWIIGRDEYSPNYSVFYFDNRHVSRVYEMIFGNGIWKLWRNSSEFSQRFTAKMSKNKEVIKGHWEKSVDGENWEHDFDVTYVKQKD